MIAAPPNIWTAVHPALTASPVATSPPPTAWAPGTSDTARPPTTSPAEKLLAEESKRRAIAAAVLCGCEHEAPAAPVATSASERVQGSLLQFRRDAEARV